jgi:hypothetical protein
VFRGLKAPAPSVGAAGALAENPGTTKKIRECIPQGLKPLFIWQNLMARLKAVPLLQSPFYRVFPQHVEAVLLLQSPFCRLFPQPLKSGPGYKPLFDRIL